MTKEFESKKIKDQRNIIIALVAVLLIVLGVKIDGFDSLTTILIFAMGGLLGWQLFKAKKIHTTAIVNDVQEQYRKDSGAFLDIRDYTQGKVGDILYFYFPYEHFGLEYDITTNSITGKHQIKVSTWLDTFMKNWILTKVGGESILEAEKRKVMEEQGYEPKS